jgi:hypothetical protein
MSPLRTLAGNSGFTLTVTGSGFSMSSTVYWGTAALATQFVSATQITAQVLTAEVTPAGITAVTVQTPGVGASNPFQFEVDSAGPGVMPPSFNPSAATAGAGSSATYTVTLPANAAKVSAQCLNLPASSTCNYASASGVVTVATASTTPAGTYPITVVFTETLPVSSSAFALLPILLLPLARVRRRRSHRGLWLAAYVVLLFAIGAGFATGCGTSQGTPASGQTQTEQVTSSAVVTLTVQ